MKQQTVHLEPDFSVRFGDAPELEIRFVRQLDNAVYILGVARSDIRVGDHFKQLYQYPPLRNADSGDVRNRQAIREVKLKVQSIAAFHNHLNCAPAGMTVALLLTGDAAPLFDVVKAHEWEQADGMYHQWEDVLGATQPLTLSR